MKIFMFICFVSSIILLYKLLKILIPLIIDIFEHED